MDDFGFSGLYLEKIHVLLASVTLFTTISILSHTILDKIFPVLKTWEVHKKVQLEERLSSMIHAVVILPYVYKIMIFDEVLLEDPVYGVSDDAMWVLSFSAGYFLWDSVICFMHLKHVGPAFLVHGLLCLICYAGALVCSLN
eukprot:TRINITY_DN2505_c0_g2_i1.p1 TRINITY_DN2505_c0_g2~~TRINITY_DN2505_c0_g2_i1.p1  ORF type:complete len:142 (+),score=14.08 TRINITY_DN2505_c0_g2_i1:3-428(+)